jgi:hypothetical protein
MCFGIGNPKENPRRIRRLPTCPDAAESALSAAWPAFRRIHYNGLSRLDVTVIGPLEI